MLISSSALCKLFSLAINKITQSFEGARKIQEYFLHKKELRMQDSAQQVWEIAQDPIWENIIHQGSDICIQTALNQLNKGHHHA